MKRKLGVAVAAVCVTVCAVLCVLVWRKMTVPQRIEAPIPGLRWGMTTAEANAALQKVGLESNITFKNSLYDTKSVGLEADELALLGFDGIEDLKLSDHEFSPVMLEFRSDRLVEIRMVLRVADEEAVSSLELEKTVTKVMESLYGSKNELGLWVIFPDDAKLPEGEFAYYPPNVRAAYHDVQTGDVKLYYNAEGYVSVTGGTPAE